MKSWKNYNCMFNVEGRITKQAVKSFVFFFHLSAAQLWLLVVILAENCIWASTFIQILAEGLNFAASIE